MSFNIEHGNKKSSFIKENQKLISDIHLFKKKKERSIVEEILIITIS